MESLATLIVILFSILLFSVPINICLTARRVQIFALRKRGLTTLRRIFIFAIGAIALFIAINLLIAGIPLGPKLFALFSIAGNAYAFKREIIFSKGQKE